MDVTKTTILALVGVCVLTRVPWADQPRGGLRLQLQSGLFTYFGSDEDKPAVRQIAALMDSVAPQIARDLKVEFRHPVTVEVYPNQKDFDAHAMNPSMRGRPAVSGRYRIQMVSPRAPIRVPGIAYKDRLWFGVHEFAHLVINQISEQVPMWLDEGVASYEGSRCFYTQDSRVRELLKTRLPAIHDLTESYDKVPAADVYSFSLVEFLVAAYGRPALNRVLRVPGTLDQILKVPLPEIERRWHEFVAARYGS